MTYRNRFLCLFCFVCFVGIASQAYAQSPGDGDLKSRAANVKAMLAQEAASLRAMMAQVEAQLERTQAKLNVQIDRVNKSSVSDIAFDDVFRMLHLQNAELTIDVEGLTARLEMLKTKTVSKNDAEVNDAQRQLLRKYVENQVQRLDTLQKLKAKGAVSSPEVAKAESLLMEAEMKLKKFEADSRKASPAMVDAIFETSLEIAEKKARLDAVKKMLAKHTDARSSVYDIAELREQAASEKLSLRKLSMQLKNLKLRMAEEDSNY